MSQWNRCDVCGRFIAFEDFAHGATRVMTMPDTAFSCEEFETLCIKHAEKSTPAVKKQSQFEAALASMGAAKR